MKVFRKSCRLFATHTPETRSCTVVEESDKLDSEPTKFTPIHTHAHRHENTLQVQQERERERERERKREIK